MQHRLTSIINTQTELRAIRDAGEILPLTADEIPEWLSLAVLVSFPAVTPLTDFQFLPSLFESEARSSHSDSKSEGLEVCSNVWYISLERGGVRVERLVFGPNMEDLRALRGQ